MPTPPQVFEQADDIIEYVEQHHARLDGLWTVSTRKPKDKLIEQAVDGNTYRGITGFTDIRGPKTIFTRWVENALDAEAQNIVGLSDQVDYSSWLEKFASDLRNSWPARTADGRKLGYGQSRKLTNLLMKCCVFWDRLDDGESQQLIHLLHMPLDLYVLKGFDKILEDPPYNIDFGNQPRMGTVANQEMYDTIQGAIRDVAMQTGYPVIYFDLWTLAHLAPKAS